jgi:hypothetical protein
MKRVPCLLVLVAILAASTLWAQQNNQQNKQQSNQNKTTTPPKQAAPVTPPKPMIHNVNPTGDRKVEEGYQKNQQENRKKRHTDQPTAVASTRG